MAESVRKALEADNRDVPEGIRISSRTRDGRFEVRVRTETVEDLLTTLDDLLMCLQLAEKVVKSVEGGMP